MRRITLAVGSVVTFYGLVYFVFQMKVGLQENVARATVSQNFYGLPGRIVYTAHLERQ